MAASKGKAMARISPEVLVTVVPEGDRPHLGKTSNVSKSGMLLEIARPLDIGVRVQLKLFLPGIGKRLDVAGDVTRDAGRTDDVYRYGVRFVELPIESEVEIERFLAVRSDRHGSSQ
jgi:PilZ domain.